MELVTKNICGRTLDAFDLSRDEFGGKEDLVLISIPLEMRVWWRRDLLNIPRPVVSCPRATGVYNVQTANHQHSSSTYV
eukprot:scaffold2782_cov182-Amphora_coffeaeformis.AAC.27